MIRVIIESPYAGDVEGNVEYARKCVRHSLLKGEAPLASHLLYTQPNILDDKDPLERAMGMQCGWEWMGAAVTVAFYIDKGISGGMIEGFNQAMLTDADIEVRSIHLREGILVPIVTDLLGTLAYQEAEKRNLASFREAATVLMSEIPSEKPVG